MVEILPGSDKEKGYFRSKIKQRHENIHYLIKNTHLESTDSKFYWNNTIEYLKNEIQEARSSNHGIQSVGNIQVKEWT